MRKRTIWLVVLFIVLFQLYDSCHNQSARGLVDNQFSPLPSVIEITQKHYYACLAQGADGVMNFATRGAMIFWRPCCHFVVESNLGTMCVSDEKTLVNLEIGKAYHYRRFPQFNSKFGDLFYVRGTTF